MKSSSIPCYTNKKVTLLTCCNEECLALEDRRLKTWSQLLHKSQYQILLWRNLRTEYWEYTDEGVIAVGVVCSSSIDTIALHSSLVSDKKLCDRFQTSSEHSTSADTTETKQVISSVGAAPLTGWGRSLNTRRSSISNPNSDRVLILLEYDETHLSTIARLFQMIQSLYISSSSL